MASIVHGVLHGRFASGAWAGEIAQVTHSFPVGTEDPTTTKLVNANIEEWSYNGDSTVGDNATLSWQTGFDGDVDVPAQTAIATAYRNLAVGFSPLQQGTFRWERVTLSVWQYDALGPGQGWGQKFGTSTFNFKSPVLGNSGATHTSTLPPQNAACISHYTMGTGSRNRGRIYVPLHKALDSSMLLSSSTINTLNTSANAFFDAIAAVQVDGGAAKLIPAVVSRVHQTYSTITETRIGDEPDTQRRRRNARVASYTDLNWP